MPLRRILIICLSVMFAASCATKTSKYPHVLIQTAAGDIEVELYPDKAPKSVAAFFSHIDSGLYKMATFYRVLNTDNQQSDAFKAELIQGGIWRTRRQKKMEVAPIPHETTKETGITHTDGTISYARQEPGSATTEFFICIGDQHGFDYGGENNPDKQGYAAFGRVVKGMNIVKTIYNRPEDDQYFTPPIWIYDIRRL